MHLRIHSGIFLGIIPTIQPIMDFDTILNEEFCLIECTSKQFKNKNYGKISRVERGIIVVRDAFVSGIGLRRPILLNSTLCFKMTRVCVRFKISLKQSGKKTSIRRTLFLVLRENRTKTSRGEIYFLVFIKSSKKMGQKHPIILIPKSSTHPETANLLDLDPSLLLSVCTMIGTPYTGSGSMYCWYSGAATSGAAISASSGCSGGGKIRSSSHGGSGGAEGWIAEEQWQVQQWQGGGGGGGKSLGSGIFFRFLDLDQNLSFFLAALSIVKRV
ncbi:hypothetical protein SDJN02_06486, partial [Cucurbita argyrosperma subsp. argyrosperma]